MIVAIDIDEVLAETLSAFIREYNSLYQSDFKRRDFYSFDWKEVLGLSQAEFKVRFGKIINNGFFDKLAPKQGAVRGVNALKKKYTLKAVTARPNDLALTTEKWLNKHFGEVFSRVYYTREHFLQKEKTSKFTVCQTIGAKVLLEDDLYYANNCLENGLYVILFDNPWNENFSGYRKLTRVNNWTEACRRVGQIMDN